MTDPDHLTLAIFERSLVTGAGTTDHLATGPAVMSSYQNVELVMAQLTHGDPLVRYPHWGRVTQII